MIAPVSGLTVGIEYETDYVGPGGIQEFLMRYGWNYTRDASVESDGIYPQHCKYPIIITENNAPLIKKFSGMKRTVSTELVSPIIRYYDVLEQLIFLTSSLEKGCEPNHSTRAAIHVHVSLEPTLKILHNTIRAGAFFETLFFYLGGMGYKYRGVENDSIYARPITLDGPPVVATANGYSQIFNTKKLLETTSMDKFWEYFGDARNYHTRYSQPARYMWLNLLRMFPNQEIYLGTLEFRVFNKSLNPYYIFAVTKASVMLTQLIMRVSQGVTNWNFPDVENSIFEHGKEKAFELLEILCQHTELRDVQDILHQIISETPEINLDSGYVMTHKNVPGVFWREPKYYEPILVPVDKIRTPRFVDIHRLRNAVGNGR